MKTTVFQLLNPQERTTNPLFDVSETIYTIPTLPAYSVIDVTLDYLDRSSVETGNFRPAFIIEGDKIRVSGTSTFWGRSSDKNRLVVHYAGIRDYRLLFPHIKDLSVSKRLGQYAEEAEVSFEAGIWMPFVMMAGAVIEGLLDDCTPAAFGKFEKMIDRAQDQKILTENDALLCHRVRHARNLIHSRRHSEAYVDRSLAMDTYVFYHELIKRHWQQPTEDAVQQADNVKQHKEVLP